MADSTQPNNCELQQLMGSHPSEDLETAIKAPTIAEGSLHEVAERYE